MQLPIMEVPRRVAPDTSAITTWLPVPGMGVLAVNAFLVHAAQPVLVDTGLVAMRDTFLDRLRSVIDPGDLAWVWLTHTDPDHVGALAEVLAEAPRARLVTTFLGFGKLALLAHDIPPERVFLVNPGQALDVGDRRLVALRPPTFDAPETTGIWDERQGVLLCADSFAALLPEPAEEAAAVAPEALREGMLTWTSIDAPWLHDVDRGTHGRALDTVRKLDPRVVLSSHLPPARAMTDVLLRHLAAAPDAVPFVGPDQAAMEAMAPRAAG